LEQGRGRLLVIDAFKEPKEAALLVVFAVVGTVDDGPDAADRLSIGECQKRLTFRILIERMPLVADHFSLVQTQWRNPVRIAAVDFPRQLEKLFFFAAGRDGLDNQLGHPKSQNKEYDGWPVGR